MLQAKIPVETLMIWPHYFPHFAGFAFQNLCSACYEQFTVLKIFKVFQSFAKCWSRQNNPSVIFKP